MLTPEYLAECADGLLSLYAQLDDSIVRMIAARIVKMGYVSDYSAWQAERLQDSGMLYQDILKAVSKYSKLSLAELQGLFRDAGLKAYDHDASIFKSAGYSVPQLRMSPAAMKVLNAGLNKTHGMLSNLTMTTALSSQAAYISSVNLAYMQVSSGAIDYISAIRKAVKTASKAGTTVLYPTGHVDKLDVAIRRAVLTGVNQTAAHLTLSLADELGSDLVEVTAHAGARPEHAEWQGKVYSISGKSTGYPSFEQSTGYGTGAGLCGWNCRHSFYPFFEGISIRGYNAQELDRLKDDDQYELSQRQRAIERTIRANRRELAGLDEAIKNCDDAQLKKSLQEDFNNKSVNLKEHEAKYKQFSKDNGLLTQNERLQVNGFGRSTSQKAVWADRKKGYSGFSKIANTNNFKITDKSINKIPLPNCKTLTDKQNQQLRLHCQSLLKSVKDKKTGTEAAITLDMSMNLLHHKIGDSGAGTIKMNPESKPYIFLHNHPDGNIFSEPDIAQFLHIENMKVIIAIGNEGSLYIIEKLPEYDAIGIKDLFYDIVTSNPTLKESAQDYINIIEFFLKGAEEYGLGVSI